MVHHLIPLGTHPLNAVWVKTVRPAMDIHFQEKGVQNTSMNPLRIGIAGQSSPPAVILVGVNPGFLSPKLGIEVAVHCRSILLQNGIDDVHVEIRESKFAHAMMMYKPAISANPAVVVREPFSTSHVLFHPHKEENKPYKFSDGTGAPRRKVMVLGEAAFKARLQDIEVAIGAKKIIIDQLNRRLALADNLADEDDASAERRAVKPKIDEANKAIEVFKNLLADVVGDWTVEENRIIGHVVLSPPNWSQLQ
jgi:hypothetical protein